ALLARTDHSALAQHGAILLSGNFLRHLEHHFYECVSRQILWSLKQHAGLAQVVDNSFMPAAQIFDAIPDRCIQFQASCPWHPSRPFGMAARAPRGGSLG